jgi:hypothetical protein
VTGEELAALKSDLLEKRWQRYEGGDMREFECPRCGWHVSSHGVSSYGFDCPWGMSPAAREKRLPTLAAVPNDATGEP